MFYTRCAYEGQYTKDQKRMHGRGIFTFANGNKYVGTFHDGAFHGQGVLFFTPENGGGQYRGVWDMGRNISGEYIFADGLPFETENWGHCKPDDDRRFWNEKLVFIRPCEPLSPMAGAQIIPDYATSDGVPTAFAGGKPRGLMDVSSDFWMKADPPMPEHAGTVDPLTQPDVAEAIAASCPRPH